MFILILELENSKKSVQFAEEEVKVVKKEATIDESKIDRLLHFLHEADPESNNTDPPEMLELEGKSNNKLLYG